MCDVLNTPSDADLVLSARQVRALDVQLRHQRSQVFGGDYFVDYQWTLLLDIDGAGRAGEARPVVRDALGTPTMLLQTLAQFEEDGFVECRVDPMVPGGEMTVLTPHGRALLDQVFEATALHFNASV